MNSVLKHWSAHIEKLKTFFLIMDFCHKKLSPELFYDQTCYYITQAMDVFPFAAFCSHNCYVAPLLQ